MALAAAAAAAVPRDCDCTRMAGAVETVPVHRYIRVVVPGRVAIVHVLAFEVSMAQGLAGEALVHKHV